MIEPASLDTLAAEIRACVTSDHSLDEMRNEVRPLKSQTNRIQPRSATVISLVGTDGGNNQVRFDPFMVQLIRVVDSSQNELCLEAITPHTPVDYLNARHFNSAGDPTTALGRMMAYLGVRHLRDLAGAFDAKP